MKKLFNKKLTKTWIVALIMLIVAIVGILIMPDIIPTHFGPSGEPDGWGTKYTVLMFPAITILVAVLAVPMMRLDPKEENYGRFEKYYYNFFFGFSLFFLAMEVINIVIAMGININMGMIMCLVTGLLMIFVGNMMPKIKQNFYFGIKTPWTLADEENWFKTHRLAGKTFVFGGIVIALGTFGPGEGKAWLLLAVVLVIVAIPLIYSAVLQMKRREGK
jgi:uncharacterized membrane protein